MGLLAHASDPWGVVGRLLEDDLLGFDGRDPGFRRSPAWPAWDLYDTPDAFVILLDAPGIDKDAIAITVAGDDVSVTVTRKTTPSFDRSTCLVSERPFGRFEQRIVVPAPVDAARVTAAVAGGVLTITLPKTHAGRARQVPVQ